MADLFDLAVDPAMPRLAREYARRAGLTYRGIVQQAALVATVPAAAFCDGSGATYSRTLDELKRLLAEKPAERKALAVKPDMRTLALF